MKLTRFLRLAPLLAGFYVASPHLDAAVSPEVSLAGKWRFQLDRDNRGFQERWFETKLPLRVHLPGSLPAQGIGDEVSVNTKWTGDIVDRSWFTAPEYSKYRQPGNVKVPFWLQPEKYYVGAAWYQREFTIPVDWAGRRVVLKLERPHWETRVWVDDREIGSNDSLSTAHDYELGIAALNGEGTGTFLRSGTHRLTVRVDNSLVVDIGSNSHSVSDHTQGNWNGIVGDITLRATPLRWIEDLQVFPNYRGKSVRVRASLGNRTGLPGGDTLELHLRKFSNGKASGEIRAEKSFEVAWRPEGGAFECELPFDALEPWDEFCPSLFQVEAHLHQSDDTKTAEIGFRDLGTQGTQIAINGTRTFIRGTLECCIFPKTGHPPTDVDSWRRIVRIAKAHGLNLIRFHSWCPPEAAFVAADELGFYYQVEIASWANQSTSLGDGKPVDDWLYREAGRILKAYGNHPSFLLMPYGNEPGGERANAFLAKWVRHWKEVDPRRLYTSGSGWPQLAENQFHVTPDPRIQGWGEGLKSRINSLPPETRTDYREYIRARQVPVISHEIGQWCVYPNFREIPKYTGYLKPRNFEIFRESLQTHGLESLAHQFLLASGKLQTLCYKEDIESALRTPGMGGFELLDLHDFPGQGTALVGVLDPFWDSKGYVTPAEYRRFCNSTVPLARFAKRVFTTTEKLEADLEVAHFGPEPWPGAVVHWKLVGDDHQSVADGSLPACDIAIGNGHPLGRISVDLQQVPAPQRYRLVVRVDSPAPSTESRRTIKSFENDWDIWVYRAERSPRGTSVLIVEELDPVALEKLAAGGKVLLIIPANRVKGDRHGRVALGFSSIFWNTAWTGRQPPHTLGILCDPKDPALKEFPTDYHSNWQWWYLVHDAGAMILDDLPRQLQPTIRVIDDWVTNRRLGLLFEARVNRGKLMVCSMNLNGNLAQNPVARQLRESLLDYMERPKFRPSVQLTPSQVQALFIN
jgi:hypothetical protein